MRIDYISGNRAIAEAAIASGLKFFAGYPITPSSDIFEYLAEELPKRGGYVIQFEDELASIYAVIGASWTCSKAMTATSGPGFSLMVEGISIAVMTETPLVIAYIMRAGPATGVPTKTGQYDVFQAEYGFHGGLPIPVFTPSNPQEAYDLTIKAFNTSEILRTPVVLLSDASIANMFGKVLIREAGEIEIIDRRSIEILRKKGCEWSLDDVYEMKCVGDGYDIYVETLTHDEKNIYRPTTDVQRRLMWRLYRKIINNREVLFEYSFHNYGNKRCRNMIITYGSTFSSVSEAVRELNKNGEDFCVFKLKTLYPINEKIFYEKTRDVDKIFVVENNVGLYVKEIRSILRDKDVISISVIDLEYPDPDEIVERVREWL